MFNFIKKFKINGDCYCQECGRKKYLRSDFCLKCWKKTGNTYHINICETIRVRDFFKLRKKSFRFKKFSVDYIYGWCSSLLCRNGVNLLRILDKEKDEYHEVVKDYETGKIIHETHEKLSEHARHGSAKTNKKN